MIQSTRELPVSLTNNTSVISFTDDNVRTRSCNNCNGWLCHEQGSPLYRLLEGGYYEVNFNVNVSSATPGVVALGLYQDRNNRSREYSFIYNSSSRRCRKLKIY